MTDLGSESIRITVDGEGIAMLTIDVPGQAANTMSVGFKAELGQLVPRLRAARDRVKGVVVTSAKKTFFAGGDLRALIAVQPENAQTFFDGLEEFKVALRGLEQLGVPVAVAINGAALGGGWEICLCAHARFCLADEKLLLGLPEASLGLLPGAGGVSRMVRKLGLRQALPLLVGGKTFSPSQALAWGLLDGTGATLQEVIEVARQWVLAHPVPVVAWDEPGFEIPSLEQDLEYIAVHGAAELHADGHGHYPARRVVYANAVEGALVDIDTALRLETRYLASLATGQVSKNMINTFFFQSNQIKSGKGRPSDAQKVPQRQLLLDGSSRGLLLAALASTSRRVPAVVRVADAPSLAEAGSSLDAVVQDLTGQGRLSASRAQASRAAVTFAVKSAQPVAPDGLCLAEQGPDAPDGALILLPGESFPAATLAPGRVGIRALPDMLGAAVVEVVRGKGSDAVLATRAYDFLQQIGKTPILVSDDACGFLHRVGAAAGHEGLALCREGYAPDFVNTATVQTDMAQGAIALASRFCAPVDQEVEVTVGRGGPESVREVQDRVLFIQALEALRCLEEGVVQSVSEANIASIQGLGFPSWTGGVIQYVNQYGLAKFAARAQALEAQCGERFNVPAILRGLVESGARSVDG